MEFDLMYYQALLNIYSIRFITTSELITSILIGFYILNLSKHRGEINTLNENFYHR